MKTSIPAMKTSIPVVYIVWDFVDHLISTLQSRRQFEGWPYEWLRGHRLLQRYSCLRQLGCPCGPHSERLSRAVGGIHRLYGGHVGELSVFPHILYTEEGIRQEGRAKRHPPLQPRPGNCIADSLPPSFRLLQFCTDTGRFTLY